MVAQLFPSPHGKGEARTAFATSSSCHSASESILLRGIVTLRKPAIGFIFVTLALDILGIGLIIPILPRLVEEFQGGDVAAASHTVGLLTALYALMQFLFAPMLGSLSDRFG